MEGGAWSVGCGVWGVEGVECRVCGLRCTEAGCRVQGVGCRVLGCRVQRFREYGSHFKVDGCGAYSVGLISGCVRSPS